MMFIPGELIALATFPGVVMHEISHRIVCDLLGIPVYEVKYFNIGSTRAGHVLHHRTNRIGHVLLIALAPLFINSLLCVLLTFPYSTYEFLVPGGTSVVYKQILFWIGLSAGANAIPSNQDVKNIASALQENRTNFLFSAACYGIYYLVRFLNLLSFVWFDFAYAFLLSMMLPKILFG